MSRVPASRTLLFASVAFFTCAADLGTKQWMFSSPKLLAHEVQWVVPQYAGYQLSLNEGGLFGMGQGSQMWLAAFSVLAAAAIPVWLFYYGAATDRLLTLALAGVMGGILGNLYDRLGFHGLVWNGFDPSRVGESVYAVRDFILLAWKWDPDPTKRIAWPNFNLADSFLVLGAAVVFYRALKAPVEGTVENHQKPSRNKAEHIEPNDQRSENESIDPVAS